MSLSAPHQNPDDPGDFIRRAQIWDEHITPAWEQVMVPTLLRDASLPEQGSVLIAECRTGFLPLHLLASTPSRPIRCIAIDPSREMLNIARDHVPEDEGRIFWDARDVGQLNYRDDVFGASFCAAGMTTRPDLITVVEQLVRLTRPGGSIGLALPLHGTFQAFYDFVREALTAHNLQHHTPHLDAFLSSLLDLQTLQNELESIGVTHANLDPVQFEVSFNSGQDFLLSPLVESFFLPHWLAMFPDESVLETILPYILQCMDLYFDTSGIVLTFNATRVLGTAS